MAITAVRALKSVGPVKPKHHCKENTYCYSCGHEFGAADDLSLKMSGSNAAGVKTGPTNLEGK